MNQHMDAALRGAMERTADGLDDNPDRYDQVAARVKRRRQQHALGGVAAATLLATVSVTLAAGGIGTGGREPVARVPQINCPAPNATVPPGHPYDRVPPLPEPVAEQGGPLVPEGPVAVRVCGLLGNITLDRDLDRLVDAMNSLELAPSYEEWLCTAEWSSDYLLVFAYPDGDLITASLEQGSCHSVLVGDQLRVQPWRAPIADLLTRLAVEEQ